MYRQLGSFWVYAEGEPDKSGFWTWALILSTVCGSITMGLCWLVG